MLLPYGGTVLEWGRYMIPNLSPGAVTLIYIVIGGIIVILCIKSHLEREARLAKETVLKPVKSK